MYYDDRQPAPAGDTNHRRLSASETTRIFDLPPPATFNCTDDELLDRVGKGRDCHEVRAIAGRLYEYLAPFKSANPGKCYNVPGPRQNTSAARYQRATGVPSELMHNRLDHNSRDSGVRLGFAPTDPGPCPECLYGKCVHFKQNTTPVPPPEHCGEMVCGDIFGPFAPSLKNKYKYAAAFIDAKSHHGFVYPMQNKSEFLSKFDYLVSTELVPKGYTCKRFHTDCDSVMQSEAFRDYCRNQCITQTFSSAYSHWQNGLIERWCYTIKNKCIAALAQSGLTEDWWFASMRHACDSHSRTPTRSNPGHATPYEMFHGKEPRFEHLRCFGADAYMRLEHRRQLGPRCEKGVFVGYTPQSPDGCYDVYFSSTNSVRSSRDVVVDERSVCPASCTKWLTEYANEHMPTWLKDLSPFEPALAARQPAATVQPHNRPAAAPTVVRKPRRLFQPDAAKQPAAAPAPTAPSAASRVPAAAQPKVSATGLLADTRQVVLGPKTCKSAFMRVRHLQCAALETTCAGIKGMTYTDKHGRDCQMKGGDLAYDFRCQYLSHGADSPTHAPISTMAMNAAPTPPGDHSGSKASVGVRPAFPGAAPAVPFTDSPDSGASVGVRAQASTEDVQQPSRPPSPKHRPVRVLDASGRACNPSPQYPIHHGYLQFPWMCQTSCTRILRCQTASPRSACSRLPKKKWPRSSVTLIVMRVLFLTCSRRPRTDPRPPSSSPS